MATECVMFTNANYIFANIDFNFTLKENFARQKVLINLPNYIFIDVLFNFKKGE